MSAWKCLSKNAATGDVIHYAEAQEVDSPESFLSSLQEALVESISSAKSFTCWLSWSSNLKLQGSHFRRCVTLIA